MVDFHRPSHIYENFILNCDHIVLQALDLGLDQFPDPADLLDCFDADAIPTNDEDILTMLSS